jgi:inorganic pyrophosphatase
LTAERLPRRVRDEVEHFFIAATALEGKDARIIGWADPAAALELLKSTAR